MQSNTSGTIVSLMALVYFILTPLTPIQRQVLTLSFGLENDQHLNLAQIGQQLNLSRERIRQIQVKAINILRHHQNDIQEYLSD
ncbi:sigma factor-like helix-turn-helix DNA-binding protein [Nostoc sp.]|uniref:sigma factor-like helix-turn-helix DNA-binding protein n=1 Tax=Nostoc sp. TaxID=1180 RepID=UPI002FF4EB75